MIWLSVPEIHNTRKNVTEEEQEEDGRTDRGIGHSSKWMLFCCRAILTWIYALFWRTIWKPKNTVAYKNEKYEVWWALAKLLDYELWGVKYKRDWERFGGLPIWGDYVAHGALFLEILWPLPRCIFNTLSKRSDEHGPACVQSSRQCHNYCGLFDFSPLQCTVPFQMCPVCVRSSCKRHNYWGESSDRSVFTAVDTDNDEATFPLSLLYGPCSEHCSPRPDKMRRRHCSF